MDFDKKEKLFLLLGKFEDGEKRERKNEEGYEKD